MTAVAGARAPVGATARVWPWLLAAITALGALLRLRTLGADDLWLDEVLTLYYTNTSFIDLWLQPNDPTPPVYYTLHKLIAGGATSEAAIRSVSAAAGIAAIPVMFALGRSLAGPTAGLAAALFLALSGPHIEYSQEARAYALAFLFILASAAGMAEHLRRADSGDPRLGRPLAVNGIFAVLAVYTHLTASLWLVASEAALLAHALLTMERAEAFRRWSRAARWTIPAALPAFGMTMSGSSEFVWLENAGLSDFIATLGSMALVRDGLDWQGWGDAVLVAALLPGVAWLFRHRSAALLVCALAAFPLLLWAGGLLKPVFMFRTGLPFLAVPILCWAFSAARLPRAFGLVLAVVVGAILTASHVGYERSGRGGFDWSGASAFLERNAGPGDVAILCTWKNFPPLRYYMAGDSALRVVGVWTPELALVFPTAADDRDPWLEHYSPQASEPVSPTELRATMAHGSTAWIVDPLCPNHEAALLDQFLADMGAAPVTRWEGRQMTISAASF